MLLKLIPRISNSSTVFRFVRFLQSFDNNSFDLLVSIWVTLVFVCCLQRGHQNSLETLPIFFVLMVVGGLKHPLICSGLGLGYTISRFFYFTGYSSGDPKGRLPIGYVKSTFKHLYILTTFDCDLIIFKHGSNFYNESCLVWGFLVYAYCNCFLLSHLKTRPRGCLGHVLGA